MKLKTLAPLWWLHPMITVLFAVAPFVISGHLMSGPDFAELWKTQKHLDRDSAVIEGLFFLALGLGIFLAWATPPISPPKALGTGDFRRLRILFLVSATLTFLGYIVWAGYCYVQGIGISEVLAVLRGEAGAVYKIRQNGGTLAGVSTATQFGMSTMIFGALLARQIGWRWVKYVLGIILFMSIIRGLLWSERLALIELCVPLAVLLFQQYSPKIPPHFRRLLILAPVIGVAGLYLYFTVSEYFRSWTSHYSTMGMSIWYFSWTRLAGYYITALNNGALAFKELGTLPMPYSVFEWFWKFPLVDLFIPYRDVFNVDPNSYMDSLKALGNQEFNNPSGIFPYARDFGVGFSALFWLFVGWSIGKCYYSFRKGGLGGSLFYPFLYISLLEMARVCYLTSARSLPSWFMLVVGYCILPRRLLHSRPKQLKRSSSPLQRQVEKAR